ncbi:hypothetical protein PHYBOEH_001054 [Phytophthora boehmeriae]|uniref:Uncharacterized protein n=1 Tax=Phytophthora boehmeriae TaxID=109152 RepID=A0A8T1WT16_9STRA|nr:hypothetical protein PHYBOEH_001054 [Phytophthora boehmeriae]
MAAGGSGSNDPNMEAPTNVSTNGDSCMWYAGESCQDSRSCYDCLNVGVVGDTCAVGPYGQCLSISKQRNGTTYYAASSTTYCESSDAVCTACRDKWLEEHANNGDMTSSSEYGTSSSELIDRVATSAAAIATRSSIESLRCAVGAFGQCLSTSELVEDTTYYEASRMTYCESSDAMCTTCRYNWLEEYAKSGEIASFPVCVGENGCVCIAVCERATRDSLVIHEECPAYETARVGSIILVLVAGVATFFIFCTIAFCVKKLLLYTGWLPVQQPGSSVQTPPRRQRSPRGPQLSLSGWKSMREKLIETEHGNEAPTAGPAGVMQIQLSTTETAAATIEEGDGFRPASPSGHVEQHRGVALSLLR